MIYDYYCSYCGKQQNQNSVLFDMQYLLTCDESRQFNILKFRMTLAELKALLSSGAAADHGYKKCKLTMAAIMGYIANKNNLDDPSIAALTMEDVLAYTKKNASTAVVAQDTRVDDYDALVYEDSQASAEKTSEPDQEYVKPAAILALENKSKALVDELYIESLLSADLTVLAGVFGEKNVYEFLLHESTDTDNEGNPVFDGYSVKTNGVDLPMKARVCNHCGTKIFSHAGTAKHQSVAFIGSPKSGKTSTILSLTHYAMNRMNASFGGGEIWKDRDVINTVTSIELVDKIARLTTDLDNYSNGIAPDKTDITKREDAYSVTFRLGNNVEGNKRYLLTLIDLPGELCVENGSVQIAKVKNLFPVALNSDAFVLCFDTQSLTTNAGMSPVELVTNVCTWADQFQNMRAEHNGLDTYVPTMVLFTKCEDLEKSDTKKVAIGGMKPLEKMYALKEERFQIATNDMYRYFRDNFGNYGHLDKAYHAMMRCSPFGYDAPVMDKLSKMTEAEKDEKVKSTSPKNVEKLMRWLLSVTGCIPTEAEYSVSANATPYQLRNFCISRPQLRSEKPGDVKKGIDDIKEAMARCALFENPGNYDKQFVGKHNDGSFVLGPVRMMARLRPNINDREGRNR